MSSSISQHIRSNVVGYVAVFIALTMGSAVASHPDGSDTIDSADIIDAEVKSVDVAAGQVKTQDVGNNAITNSKLADDSIAAPEIATDAVGSPEVADDSLGGTDVNEADLDQSVLQRRVSDACADGEAIQAIDAAGTDVTCEAVGGGGPPTGAAGGDLAGSYPDPNIAANAVGTNEVGLDALGSTDLAPNAVGSSEVSDGTLSAADLGASSVGTSEAADNSLGGTDINESTLGEVPSASRADFLEDGADDLAPFEIGGAFHVFGDDTCLTLSAAFASCVGGTFNMPAPGHVLAIGSGGFVGFGTGPDHASCTLTHGTTPSGTTAFSNAFPGQANAEHNSSARTDVFTITGLRTVSAGSNIFTMNCAETDGGVQVLHSKLALIYLR